MEVHHSHYQNASIHYEVYLQHPSRVENETCKSEVGQTSTHIIVAIRDNALISG
jgi:hypothetical protein